MHSITDKAEVSIDFPDKFYMGGFGRDSSYEAKAEDDAILIGLVRGGEQKRSVAMHLHYFLLASVIEDFARSLAERPPIDEPHRQPLLAAARLLVAALERGAAPPSSA